VNITDSDDSTAASARPVGRPPGASAPTRCWQGGCSRTDVERCAFVDRYERRCASQWCPEHARTASGGQYCRRHASVVPVLPVRTHPSAVPELDNRAPSLVNFVAQGIDAPVRALLKPRATAGEAVAVEPVHVAMGTRSRRWEHAWSLRTTAGHDRLRVALEVDDLRDPEIGLRIGREVVSRSIPPWIGRRLRNERVDEARSAAERADFFAALVGLIRETLDSSERP